MKKGIISFPNARSLLHLFESENFFENFQSNIRDTRTWIWRSDQSPDLIFEDGGGANWTDTQTRETLFCPSPTPSAFINWDDTLERC